MGERSGRTVVPPADVSLRGALSVGLTYLVGVAVAMALGREVPGSEDWLAVICVTGFLLLWAHEGAHWLGYVVKGVERRNVKIVRRLAVFACAVEVKENVSKEAVLASLAAVFAMMAVVSLVVIAVLTAGGLWGQELPLLWGWTLMSFGWLGCVRDAVWWREVRQYPAGTMFRDEGDRLLEC
jgi:hypothetical protein